MSRKQPTEYIYIIAKSPCGPAKIGISNNPRARCQGLQGGNPNRLKVMDFWTVPDRETALLVERHVLRFYTRRRLTGEWIDVDVFSVATAITSCLEAMFTPLQKAAA